MKTFTNANARDSRSTRSALAAQTRARAARRAVVRRRRQRPARRWSRIASSRPTSSCNLKTIKGLDQVTSDARRPDHRRTDHARRAQPRTQTIRSSTRCWPRRRTSVATPQIRNVGTLAGNVCQRPWCWYFRNGFPCYKTGGNQCFSFAGENQFHAIFGGGPSYIVHPSDTAPALVALDATFRIAGPAGERTVAGGGLLRPAARRCRARERARRTTRCCPPSCCRTPRQATRSTYHKVMDREAWTHAVVSAAVVLTMDGGEGRVPRRADRARRRRADSLAAAGGRRSC